MEPQPLIFNGIDGATGGYLLSPLTIPQVAGLARGRSPRGQEAEELRCWVQERSEPQLGPEEGVDPRDLAQAGWGAIVPRDADPAVLEALAPLLEHRRRQATRHEERRFRLFAGEDGYRRGESKRDLLARHGVGPGPADPDRVPYYLLLVGDPEAIPFRVQHQLDVQYAVGRLHLPTAADYARYAQSVVTAESGGAPVCRRVAFFGVENADDPSTRFSAEHLLRPLAGGLAAARPGWETQVTVGEGATKARLARLLGGEETPSLLFTTSHGMGFPAGDPRQYAHQGALLCQDWPGPRAWRGRIPPDHYLCGDDVGGGAGPTGLVSFHYACFGGGTPRRDVLLGGSAGERRQLAPESFVARLPQRLLGHPRGGALAVVAHVGRAWGYSYAWPEAGRQLQVFESALLRLLDGHPVGSALESFHLRYAELTSDLAAELEEIDFGKRADESALAALWTAAQDARAYVLLGDPAVRLPGAASASS